MHSQVRVSQQQLGGNAPALLLVLLPVDLLLLPGSRNGYCMCS